MPATVRPATDPAPATPLPAAEWVAVAGYEVLERLGQGGMGVVYKARQLGLDRVVALTMILHGEHAEPAQRERFRTKAQAVARLQHPHIVQVFEVGECQGLPYFSMEYCPGGSLAEVLDGTPWEPLRAAGLVEALAHAMHAAHAAGIVHRDLKPANVLLAMGGIPKVTDFSLARRLGQQGADADRGSHGNAVVHGPGAGRSRPKQ
jgi:serine/threonine protein kinase